MFYKLHGLYSGLNSKITDIVLRDRHENANPEYINIKHDYSFAKDNVIYLNVQMEIFQERYATGALFRYPSHLVSLATQYFSIIDVQTGLTHIGYSDPATTYLHTYDALTPGEYRIIGTLKIN